MQDAPQFLFRSAVPADVAEIYTLYRQAVGTKFCIWNESYPGMRELQQDLETENLFVLTLENAIIGTISIVPENEMDDLACWRSREGTEREIARVVVAPAFQGRGLAYELVQNILPILSARGCSAVRLSVAKGHIPARKTYLKAGFQIVGEAELYGGQYELMEKALERK